MDCFTLRVRSFGFFLSYTIEIANKVTRSTDPYLQKRNLLIGLIMDCFTLRVRSFGYFSFSKLRGRRPRQSILRPLIQWTASHFMFAVSIMFHFRNCEAEGRGNPFCVFRYSGPLHTSCSQFRVFSFIYLSKSRTK